MSVSILILTKNEEKDLPKCLQSVSWSDDIHVFDSFSDDRTISIARESGAKVTQRRFEGYASQRNASLKEVKYKYAWVLVLDADECVPSELAAELQSLAKDPGDNVAFRIRRRDFLWGRWLKHAQISPYYVRFVRWDSVHYEREVNEVLTANGPIGEAKHPFDHFPFSKGMTHWLDKHNRYSSMEAQRWLDEQEGDFSFSLRRALFGKDFHERRYHQKGLFYLLPGRPLIKFFYMMIIRRAILDGSAGIAYSALQSIYEYFIVLKQRELIQQKKTP